MASGKLISNPTNTPTATGGDWHPYKRDQKSDCKTAAESRDESGLLVREVHRQHEGNVNAAEEG